MNSILQKACDELAKDEPNIPYVRGMLETVLAMSQEPKSTGSAGSVAAPTLIPKGTATLIEGIPPTQPIDKIKALAEASAE